MAIKFKVTLQAVQYTTAGGGTLYKGWTKEFAENDPALIEYKQNPCFILTKVIVPEPLPVDKPKEPDDSNGGDSFEGHAIKEITAIDEPVIKLLEENGFATVEAVKAAEKEKITAITGIGEATYTKIENAVNAYIASLPDDDENKENE